MPQRSATQYPSVFSHSGERPLGFWLMVVTIVNILLASTDGFGSDIAFWVDWIGQLQRNGFEKLEANYPPLYMHWLWLVGKFMSGLQITPEANLLLRHLCNAPIVLAHGLLLLLLDRCLKRSVANDLEWNIVIGFAALNPALLIDGPLWGQVDLLFSFLLVLALYTLIEGRYLILSLPILVIAVLTKFQTICVAPVILPLLWHRRHSHRLWFGAVPALGIAVLLLLPYFLAGSTGSMFDQTYLKASSLYPYATMNGANLWYLFGLNMRPDSLVIFDWAASPEGWYRLFTPKYLGMGFYAALGLVLTTSSFLTQQKSTHWRNAIISACAFFLLLPAMHERYMFPAAVIALVAAACNRQFAVHAVWISLLSAANILLLLPPRGIALEYAVAALTVLFVLWMLAPRLWASIHWRACYARIPISAWLILAFSSWLATTGFHVNRALPSHEGWIDATSIKGRMVQQEWGDLALNAAVSGRALRVGGEKFASGFGTHAASSITIPVPQKAISFSTRAGIDDATEGGGYAEFSILADNALVWKSGPMSGGKSAVNAQVDVRNAKTLTLVTDALGENRSDHADWIHPRFHLEQ
ncbi:NPCBM/NEW2 domain-containing protein [Uliginosibacterium sp. TH139]|uniref:NPCBM/NEW2 domain-containing protein n=1 Tax=Uliginosibacterium sp. TH139 TaxID=2067453 RepID=UPI000C7BC733|nr:NPCBM/NEW2 domain-containing protein [Uliginosibacterium sp. TH139]PLK48503.1 hypothetical protein C0V76_10565 [Uliginosibacterium sp. TH139]